ncbi:amidohydrolase [Caldisalinibacter kiritimatiensis]|uniref:Amidohydrolase n=1 Tax=Caldisalinibacter kiritimatiensis TaxID=1304284 RepID=R1CNX6_9FIRM|nr:amidohydrolase [Caldisalinibacter kiritimatiensis]EOD00401.1 amidohydrolase [Caldisalinibacter kiritimatiensis]
MLLIKNGTIYTMAGEIIENGSILIENGKIKEIGKDIVAPLDVEVIDAEGKMVTPGFIDAHCHIGLFEDGIGFEGDDGNEMVDPVTPHLRGIDGINPMDRTFEEAYQGGVTCAATGPGSANVIGGQFAAIKTYGRRIDDMIVKEPLAMKIAFGENPKRVYNAQKKSPMTRMATAAILRETLFKAKNYVEKQEKAKEDPSKAPEFDMKMEAMAKVIRKEIPLKAHAHRADDILTAIRIAKEFDVDITLEHCTEGHLIADYLAEEQKPTIVGPSLSERSKFELKNLTFETPGVLNKAGVKVAIMTDSPVIPLQYLPLCAGLAVKSGMDEMEALKAITINAAEILGIDDRVGSIEVGKDADIVIFDGNPLKDINCKTVATIIDGKVVYKR